MVDTTKVEDRRELEYATMSEILDDIEYLASGDPPRTIGNWSSAQIVLHVTSVINYSLDGFPRPRAPLALRLIGRLMRKRALTKTLPAGLKFPKGFEFLTPPDNVPWDDAVDRFRRAIRRLDTDRMTQRSPVLGKLSHDQWVRLHCRHAELHFSFMHPA